MRIILIISCTLFTFSSCIKAPDFPDEPVIEFISLSQQVLNQGALNIDSTLLIISYTDGDGNLGSDNGSNVFITDTRDGFQLEGFQIPKIPEEGSTNGISGTLEMLLYTTCCYFPDGTPPCNVSSEFPIDSVSYEVYIVDRDGNESNRILTPFIEILCN